MGRKRQKEPELKLVAPEPASDEWEANVRWDRVSAAGPAPAFFDGTHTAASTNVFDVVFDVEAAAATGVAPERARVALAVPRAVERFVTTEQELLAVRARAAETVAALHDFTDLARAEDGVAGAERQRLEQQLTAAVQELELVTHDAREVVRRTTQTFHDDREAQLSHLMELTVQDGAIERAFDERVATLQERDRVVDAYFAEHSAHVTNMERLQTQSAATRSRTLDAMTATLLSTAEELTATTMQGDTDDATETRRAQLVEELLRLERHSRDRARRQEDAAHGAAELRRRVELETQKAQLAAARNAVLREQVDALRARTELGAGAALEPSFAPDERRVDAPDAMNEIAAVRRQLDALTAAVACDEDRLQRLRRQHQMRQSGAYRASHATAKVTRSYVDAETGAAVRAVVRAAMREVEEALGCAEGTVAADETAPLAHLGQIQSFAQRMAVQNYVAHRVNEVLKGSYPLCTM